MNYGFVIDNRKCIGCHACSTACKSENEVPLGVYRTWVKYVEVGAYPDVRRHFQVTRCNHCANPPCVRICPVAAMYQRSDGIVEFDPRICIGCKACLQACPYDAIYLDPDSGTAAKCHFCAHRIEIGLEPACVILCPEHAILAGDIDDPGSEISRVLAANDVTVRKPEQGTAPKLFYIEGNAAVLHPTATERTPQTFLWADVIPLHGSNGRHSPAGAEAPLPAETPPRRSHSGAALRPPQPQGAPTDGPIFLGQGRAAAPMAQTSYNAQHKIPWHWPVPAYLVSKAAGSGIFMLLSLGWGLGAFAFDSLTAVVAGLLSLLMIGLNTALLVYDLDRPERFFSILFRPQWRSWLARGAFILVGFTIVAGGWWLLESATFLGRGDAALAALLRPILLWLGLPLAAGVAVYTAFLFGQAEGRDLWQSGLLPVHLIVQALLAGAAALLALALTGLLPGAMVAALRWLLALLLGLDLLLLLAEFGMPHASEVAAQAAHAITHGHYKGHFWGGAILIGHLLPLALLLIAWPAAAALAGLAALLGLFLYEYAFVMAPQEIANS